LYTVGLATPAADTKMSQHTWNNWCN